MSFETESDSYSSKYRQFSVSSPDLFLNNTTNQFNPNQSESYLNKLNKSKFTLNLTSKFNNTTGKFKIPQISLSNNELFAETNGNWINGVTKYFKPIFSYININNRNQTKLDSIDDDFKISNDELDKFTEIGRGNQGTVFVAYYKKINRMVAVKQFKEFEKIGQNEINYLKKLKHPNIIKFLGVTMNGSIVMEYCSKGQLFDALEQSIITRDLVVSWSKQIVKGMKYLHENNVVHRDLKSPNILINDCNNLKICDFGNCKKEDEMKSKVSFAGTVCWMAPEVIKGDRGYSEKIDVWSFGVVFWELIFCEHPYHGINQNVIMICVGNNKIKLPIPETFNLIKYKNIMQQCFNFHEPHKRPDFGQILSDLKIANKEFLNQIKDDKEFFELKKKWKEEINYKISTISETYPSSDEDSTTCKNLIGKKSQNRIMKLKLKKELKIAEDLLRKIRLREESIKRREEELGIKNYNESTSNGLINSLGRKSIKNLTSSLRLNRFAYNRSRRSFRLHTPQLKHKSIKKDTKDAEIQTNFDNFEDDKLDNRNLLLNQSIKNQDLFNNCIIENRKKLINNDKLNRSSKYLNDNCINHKNRIVNQDINNELPGGYLEASFENSLMLKKGTNYCKFNRTKYNGSNGLIKNLTLDDIKRNNLEITEFEINENFTNELNDKLSSSDEDNLSIDSLNNNKYSKIYRTNSDSFSSSMNSLSWSDLNKSKLSIESDTLKPYNVLKFNNSKDDIKETDDLSNNYLVLPKINRSIIQNDKLTTNHTNYLVLNTTNKDHLTKKNVRDSLLLYKSKGLKKDDFN